MNRGFIKLWRKFQDNHLWKERRVFSKAEAWLDILMEAQHSEQDQQVLIGNTLLVCRQGECLKSTRTWAKRWRWSEHKVRLFFDLMLKSGNLDAVNEGKTTRLIIRNYSLYNNLRRTRDADHDARATHARRTTGDRQECKECKNEKEIIAQSCASDSSEQPASDPVLFIPLIPRDGEFPIYQQDIDEWQAVFPGVDVLAELRKCRLWNIDNEKRRKTSKGIRNHIRQWLDKAQNGTRASSSTKPAAEPAYYEELN